MKVRSTGRRAIRLRRLPRAIGAAARVWSIIARIRLERFIRTKGTDTMNAHDIIRNEVLSWPGVTEEPHRFGGMEFRIGKRELGHLHGDYLADLPFPVRIREELVRDGKAMPHHILPQSGWVSYPIRDAAAVPGALDLFRLAYDRATASSRFDVRGSEKDEATTPNSELRTPNIRAS
jgi:hypothetical protein